MVQVQTMFSIRVLAVLVDSNYTWNIAWNQAKQKDNYHIIFIFGFSLFVWFVWFFFFARRIFFMLFHVFCVHSWSSWASRSCTCGWPIWTRRWSAKFWNCAGATRRNGGPSSTPWTRSASGNKTFEEQSNQQQQQQQPCATTRKRRQEDENWGGRGSKTLPKEKKTSQPNIVSGAFGFPFLFFLSYFLFFCSLFFVCCRNLRRRMSSEADFTPVWFWPPKKCDRTAGTRGEEPRRSFHARFTLISLQFYFCFFSAPNLRLCVAFSGCISSS